MSKPNFTVQEIRDAYPTPVAFKHADDCNYCVGGALVMFLANIIPADQHEEVRFPSEASIRAAVEKYNYNIPYEIVEYCVSKLVYRNDLGDFDIAWAEVDCLLKYPRADAPNTL
jgi:hypothetical protein